MSTSKGQRIGIWVIVVFMIVGTIGSFAIIALSNQNQANDTARMQELQADYQKDMDAYNTKLNDIFKQHFGEVASYKERVSAFDAASVTELSTEDIKVGEGKELGDAPSFKAFYIGWNPKGKIFDSSFDDNDKVKSEPFDTSGGVIEGWTKGASGMREGSARLMTIPSSLAYGETGSGEDIPANTPLRFIMFVLPSDVKLPQQPEMPEELYRNLMRQYGQGQ